METGSKRDILYQNEVAIQLLKNHMEWFSAKLDGLVHGYNLEHLNPNMKGMGTFDTYAKLN